MRKHCYYLSGHTTTTIGAFWSGANDFHVTGFTMLNDSPWMNSFWKSAFYIVKWAIVNQSVLITKLSSQNTCPIHGYESFIDHPYRNLSIKEGGVNSVCSMEVSFNDVLLNFQLQSNGSLHALVTRGGIHGLFDLKTAGLLLFST